MSYGTLNTDIIQSSTAGTPPQFNDGNGTQTGVLCRAWVNFGYVSAAMTTRGSFNVTSVTRNSAGNYTANFTNAMPDANYTTVIGGNAISGGTVVNVICLTPYNATTPSPQTTTTVNVISQGTGGGGTPGDHAFINIAVFR